MTHQFTLAWGMLPPGAPTMIQVSTSECKTLRLSAVNIEDECASFRGACLSHDCVYRLLSYRGKSVLRNEMKRWVQFNKSNISV